MVNLTGPCVCGGSYDRPNGDCERCQLIGMVAEMLRELFDWRRRRFDDAIIIDELATDFNLRISDVERIVGLADEEFPPFGLTGTDPKARPRDVET